MMLRMIRELCRDNTVNFDAVAKRHLSYRGLRKTLKNIFQPRDSLPYCHVCQIGDPVLRAHAQPVDPDIIVTPEFQPLIKHMTDIMRTYNAIGLSATQIGLPYQIFIIEVTKKHLGAFDEAHRKMQKIELTPLQVFINPKMKVVDYTTIKCNEECLSVLGYSAVVPRARTVAVEALDAFGKPFVWKGDGWAARIVQHEMDHLQGTMYVDRMDRDTFSCQLWMAINARRGNVGIHFYPRSRLRRFLSLY